MEASKIAFELVMSRLQGEDSSRLRSDLQRLWSEMMDENERVTQFKTRIGELESEIASEEEKVQQVESEQELQAQEKKEVEEEIESCRKQKQEQKALESKLKEKLEGIQQEIGQLEEFCQEGSDWTPAQEKELMELRKEQADLEHFLEQKLAKLQSSRQEIQVIRETVEEAESQREKLEGEMQGYRDSISENELESREEQLRKDRADSELRVLKGNVEQHQIELSAKTKRFDEEQQELRLLTVKLDGAKNRLEQYFAEYDNLHQQTQRLTGALDDQVRINKFIGSQLEKTDAEIEVKKVEGKNVNKEMEHLKMMTEHCGKRISTTEEAQVRAEKERLEIRERTKATELEIDAARKENDTLRRQLGDLTKEKEILGQTIEKAEDRTKHANDLIAVYQSTQRNLENEIQGYKTEAIRVREGIEALEDDVKKYESNAVMENQNSLNAVEEAKMRDARIVDLQKRISEGETRLKQQQNLYEAVRSDRNLYSKNLIEAQEGIAEMKRKFKIMNHQIEQLKDEITGKDHSLVKEHFAHHKVEKEREQIKYELTKVRKQTQSSEQIISNQESEIQKLSQVMHEAEDEHVRQQKEHQAILSERDILSSQLTKRSEELTALYEKIKLQMSALRKGEHKYRDSVRKIQRLKGLLRQMRSERKRIEDQTNAVPNLDGEIAKLEREIVQERSKVKALSEEKKRPLNVHRWRKLKSSDPERFHLLERIQHMQLTLISEFEELAAKNAEIAEKEQLYKDLQMVLARQPGPEVADQFAIYQQNLKDKTRQLREMEEELKNHQMNVEEFKEEIGYIDEEMKKLRTNFIDQRIANIRSNQTQDEDFNSSDGIESVSGSEDEQSLMDDRQEI